MRLEVHAERLEKALRDAPEETRKGLSRVLTRAGVLHENVVKRRRFGVYRGRAYADKLQRRRGSLANAYAVTTRPSASRLEMVAGIRSGLPGSSYARIQEFGGTVRPKRGKYLTVPLPAALTGSGALSGRYRIRRSGSRYVTDAGPTFIFKSKRGNLIVAVKQGANVKPIYVLRRQVTIRPRFGFFDAWAAIERSRIPAWTDQVARGALGEGS